METESKNEVNRGDRLIVNPDMNDKGAKMSIKPNHPGKPQNKQPMDSMDEIDDVFFQESCELVDLTCDSPEPDHSFDTPSPSRNPSSREVEFRINSLQKEFLPPWELRKLNAEQKQTLAEKYLKLTKGQRSELTHSQRHALNRMLFQTDIPFAQLGKEQKRAQRVGMEKVMRSDQKTKYIKLLTGGLPHQEALCEILGQNYVQAIELIDMLLNDSTDIQSKPLDWDKDFLINVTRHLFPSPSEYSRWTHEQRKSLAIKYGQLRKNQQVFLSKNQRQKMVKMLEQVNRAGLKPVPAAKVPEQSFGIQQNAVQPWAPFNQPRDDFWPGCMVKAKQDMFGWFQENLPSMNNQSQSPFGLPPVYSNQPFQSHQMNPFGLPLVAPDPSPVKRQSSYHEEPVSSKRSRFTEESDQYIFPGMHHQKAPSPPQFQMKQSSSGERNIPPSAESSESFNLFIVPSKYPNEILTEREMDIIENSILETVLEIGDGAMPPTFNGSFRNQGRYQVICADKFSKEWLFKFLRMHPLWPNASLKICAAKATEIRVRALLPPCNDDDAKILKFISAQNKGLTVDVWRVVERNDSNTSTSLIFVVDVESANVLRCCGKINFKMGKAEISILDDQIAERDRGSQAEIQRVPSPHGSVSSRGRSHFHQERVSEKTVNEQPSRHGSRECSDAFQGRGSKLPGCIQPREHPFTGQLGYHQERVSELPGCGLLREHANRAQPSHHQEGGLELHSRSLPRGHPKRDQDGGLEVPGCSQSRDHSNRDQPGYHQERGSELPGGLHLPREHPNRDQLGYHQAVGSVVPGHTRLREQPSHYSLGEQPSHYSSPFDQERGSELTGRSQLREHRNRDQPGYHKERGPELTRRSQLRKPSNRDQPEFHHERGSELTGHSQLREHSNRDRPGYHQERGSQFTGHGQLREYSNRDQPGYHQERGSELPGRSLLREHSNRSQPEYHRESGIEVPEHSRFREQSSEEPSPFGQERVPERLRLGRPKEHSPFKDRSGSGAPDVRPSPWITNPFKSGTTEEHGRFQDTIDRRSKNPSFSDPWVQSVNVPDVEPKLRSRWDTADRPGQSDTSMFPSGGIRERPSHPSRSRPQERTPLPSSHPRGSSPIHRRRREFSWQ